MTRALALSLVSLVVSAAAMASCGDGAGSTGTGNHGHGGATDGSGGGNGGAVSGSTTGSGGDTSSSNTSSSSTSSSTTSSGTGGGMPSPCPPDMAFVETFCMDHYEAPNQPGADPLVMQSALDGEAWCEAIGKRLCTEDEWVKACEGPQMSTYPYGDTHIASQCNDDKTWMVVNESALNTWPSQTAQDEVAKLWQGAPSGSYPECVSTYGVYDLTGNIEEWVVRTQPHVNSYPHVLKGCYWAGCYGGASPRCASTNPAHASAFRYYETGFRCCKDLEP